MDLLIQYYYFTVDLLIFLVSLKRLICISYELFHEYYRELEIRIRLRNKIKFY